jgi:hypothetical protein
LGMVDYLNFRSGLRGVAALRHCWEGFLDDFR